MEGALYLSRLVATTSAEGDVFRRPALAEAVGDELPEGSWWAGVDHPTRGELLVYVYGPAALHDACETARATQRLSSRAVGYGPARGVFAEECSEEAAAALAELRRRPRASGRTVREEARDALLACFREQSAHGGPRGGAVPERFRWLGENF